MLTAMLMPCLANDLAVNFDKPPNCSQLPRAKAVVCCKLDRLQPELARLLLSADMHVNWLITIETIEKEPVGPDAPPISQDQIRKMIEEVETKLSELRKHQRI